MRDKWKTDVGQMADRTVLEWNGIVQAYYIQYSTDDYVSDTALITVFMFMISFNCRPT
jgi:hypothetical protein